MTKRLYYLQTALLLAGTILAWVTVFNDFSRHYDMYGSLTRINDCVIPNPVMTPCFYGAFAFLLAFIWSINILRNLESEKIAYKQKRLWILLIAGTIFAWSNFSLELIKFYSSNTEKLSCSGVPTNNVFLTPCFFGAAVFLLTLIVATIIKYRKEENKTVNTPES